MADRGAYQILAGFLHSDRNLGPYLKQWNMIVLTKQDETCELEAHCGSNMKNETLKMDETGRMVQLEEREGS